MEVYKILFPDGACYIGKTTKGHLVRFKGHLKNYKHYNKIVEKYNGSLWLYDYWAQFGIEGAKVSLLGTADDKATLNALEMYHILTHKWYLDGLDVVRNPKSLNVESYTTQGAFLYRVFNNDKNLTGNKLTVYS
jgi:hypothetical protein